MDVTQSLVVNGYPDGLRPGNTIVMLALYYLTADVSITQVAELWILLRG